jgi:hypothetical protein
MSFPRNWKIVRLADMKEETMKRALLFTVFVAVCGSMGLQGGPIPVTNAGFESDVLAPGGFTSNTFATGWTCTPVGGPTDCGVFRPQAAQYPGGAPEGVNVAYSNGGTITQNLAATLALNTTYTLSVDVGKRLDMGFTSYLIELLAGSTVIASDNTTLNPAAGTFLLSTRTYNSGAANILAGQTLSILLRGNAGGQPDFDAVALNAVVSAVPEPGPATLCLIGLGLICTSKLRGVLARR